MPLHEHKPKIHDIKSASDCRIDLHVRNVDGSVRDYTGATGTATFVPRRSGSSFTRSIVLSGDPTALPQAYVDVVPADTSSLSPQEIDVFIEVTVATKKDRLTFWFRLLKGTA